MTLTIDIPLDDERRLREQAKEAGVDVSSYARRLLHQGLAGDENLDHVLAPIRQAFAESGMTEDELVELLEREKHAMRAEKRARG